MTGKKSGNKKDNIMSGMAWSFAERISAQLVSTVVGIVLARILSPNEYGIVSIVMVFISICNVFVTRGFGTTIVQKKKVDELDYNTAFILNMSVAMVLYLILFIFAPILQNVYQIAELTEVIRILGIRIPIAAINTIQQAHIQRNMQYKKFFIATLTGTTVSCFVGIIMAYQNFGVWALVAQYLTNVILNTIVLFIISDWYPKIMFSREKMEYIISFGGKILLSDLLCTIVDNYRNLVAGKVFGSLDLAYMDQGKKYPHLFMSNIIVSIQKVMLPAFSTRQDNKENIKELLRISNIIGMALVAPIMIGLAAVSKNFVEVILTEKWLPAVPYIWIFTISYLTRPFETMSNQAILALGKSGTVFKILVVTNSIDILFASMAAFVIKDIYVMACTIIIVTLSSVFLFTYINKRILNYTIKEQIKDIFPVLIVSCMMGVIVFYVGQVSLNKVVVLFLQIITGVVVYVLFSMIFKLKSYVYVKEYIVQKLVSK